MKWILNIVRRRQVDGELAQEVESHIEEKVADLMEAGMPEREARQKANREFGNVVRYKEISREVWSWVWLETLWQDVRYGARMLRKNPGFTCRRNATPGLGNAGKSKHLNHLRRWLLQKARGHEPSPVVCVVATDPAR